MGRLVVIAFTLGAVACGLQTGGLRASSDAADASAPPVTIDAGPPPSVDAALPDVAAPPVDAASPPVPGALTVVAGPPAATIDLTAEGTLDWVHWGRVDAKSIDRKAGPTGPIGAFASVGTSDVKHVTDYATSFVWSDGTPTASNPGTTTGVYVSGVSHGVTLDVAADATPRTLVLYLGGYTGAALFQARLSDRSAPDVQTTQSSASGSFHGAYTVAFNAATAGQLLTVTWTLTKDDTFLPGDSANVTLESATLR